MGDRLLGRILSGADPADVLRHVRPVDFPLSGQRDLARFLAARHKAGLPYDLAAVSDALMAHDPRHIVDRIGGFEGLSALADGDLLKMKQGAITSYGLALRLGALDSCLSSLAVELGAATAAGQEARAGDLLRRFVRLARMRDGLEGSKAAKPPGVLCSEVVPEAVSPLWQGRLYLGKIAVLDGDPGCGKSTLTLDLAARLSTGAPMPDGSPGLLGGALVVSVEDGVGDTIVPRLKAAGANLSRIVALSGVPDAEGGQRIPTLPADIPVIEAAALRVGARLVILDPLMALLSGGVDSHRDQDVRRALAPLEAMAERLRASVLIVRHLNKGANAGGSPLYRGGGSIGIGGAARSGFLVAKDPGNPSVRVLSSSKNNLGPEAPSLQYEMEGVMLDGLGEVARIRWEGVSPHTASSLLDQSGAGSGPHGGGALEEAAEFLSDLLADGPVSSDEIRKKAEKAEISRRTLFRVRETGLLAWKSSKNPLDGEWYWELNRSVPTPGLAQLAHMKNSTLVESKNRSVPSVPSEGVGTVEMAPDLHSDCRILEQSGAVAQPDSLLDPSAALKAFMEV